MSRAKFATERNTFGERLDSLQNALNLPSQNDLATILHISSGYLSDLRTGKKRPGRKIIHSLARIGANIEWFLTGAGDMFSKAPERAHSDKHQSRIKEYLVLTEEVLSSGNPLASDALERNILYFAHAIRSEQRLKESERRLAQSEQRLSEMDIVITTLKQAVEELQQGCGDRELGKDEEEGGSEHDEAI
jgi:transcriptional regulator with XRE-family HTH domain